MDFSYSDDQQALRELARKILEEKASHERLKEIEASPERFDRDLWNELAKANYLGLTLAEEFGGSAMGLPELAILLEELGRAVAPVPVYATLVLGALPVAEFGSDAQKKALLPGVAAGDLVLSAALVEPGSEDPSAPRATARKDGSGWILSGTKGLVPVAHLAERVLVVAKAPGGLGVFLVDPKAEGVTLVRQEVTSREPQFVMQLADVSVSADDVLGSVGAEGARIASWLHERAVLGLCAVSLGVCERALERTAQYTRERKQFDVPIGSFQAVHQRVADAYIDVLAIRLTMLRALHLLETGQDATDAIRVAKFWAGEGGNRITYAAQHLHGGIGLDLDYPLHRYFLWARQIAMSLGSSQRQLLAIGADLAA